MENNHNYQEERFDSFLNKTIIFSSKDYFRKQMKISKKEQEILDDEECNKIVESLITLSDSFSCFDNVVTSIELRKALKTLSAIEQAVIILLFQEDLPQDEIARILEIYYKSVSKIKIRAINKLKKYFKGDGKNEK